MTRSKEIQDELHLVSPKLAEYQAVTPYSVPAGYFETLPYLILDRIYSASEESASSELNRISPLLASASKKMPFAIPENYFDGLVKTPAENATQADEESTVEGNRPAKIVVLRPNKLFRYAAAAVGVGMFFLAAWFYTARETKIPDQITQKSEAPAEKILEQRIENVSEEEMATFVENNNALYLLENTLPAGELAGTDALFMFDEISDQELEQYLRNYHPAKEKFN